MYQTLPDQSNSQMPMINPFDPSMQAYIAYENQRIQSQIYMKEKHIAQVQTDIKQKIKQEKRLQEIMQLCDLKENLEGMLLPYL